MTLEIESIEKELNRKEKILDTLLMENRTAVRFCANCIKSIHAKDMKGAKENLKKASQMLKKLKDYYSEFGNHVGHIFQEYVEAEVLLAVAEKKQIPSHKELDAPVVPYLLGLLDCVGELKREMYEHLRKGNKKEAERYFHQMEWIFHGLMHLKYSNAVLPEFRRKQDVARIQIEQARGELI